MSTLSPFGFSAAKSRLARFAVMGVLVVSLAGVIAPATAHAVTLSELVELFIALEIIPAEKADQARSVLATSQAPSASSVCPYVWTRDLAVGSTGADVKKLQEFLNTDPDTELSSSGAGSPGNETVFFGAITRDGVVRFQEKYASDVLTPLGLASGTGYFGMSSRAKANALCEEETAIGGISPDEEEPVITEPELGVALSADQPTDSLVPENAARVPFTKIDLSARGENVTVENIEVERGGFASNAAFDGVILMNEDGTLIGIEKTLGSNDRATLGTSFTIPENTTKTVIIGANTTSDLSQEAGEKPTFAVVAVNASKPVVGALPIVGATHTMNSSLSIGSVTAARGTHDPGVSVTKEVGSTDYYFSGIRITAGSAEDVVLKSIRWHQSGSASGGDFANLRTVVDGTDYAITQNGDYYTTVFPGGGIEIKKGFSKDVSIRGDVAGGSNRTVDFDIERRTDIHLVGGKYGFGIMPPFADSTASNDSSTFSDKNNPYYDASQVTVSAGSMNVSSWTGVPAQNIAENVTGQPFAGFAVEVRGEPITVSSSAFDFTLTEDTGSDVGMEDLTNVTLVDENGSVLAGPVDGSGTGTTGTITFSDSVTYPVGTTHITVRGKLGTDFDTNDLLVVATTPEDDWTSVRGDETGQAITPAPSSAISGPTMTVRSGSLSISVSTSPSARNVVAGAEQFEFARYFFSAARSSEDTRVASIPLHYDTTGNRNDLTNCKLYDGIGEDADVLTTGGNVKNPTDDDAVNATTFTFDNAGLIIPKGTTKTVSLRCDLATGTAGSTYEWGIDSGQAGSFTGATGVTSGETITESITDSDGQTMTSVANGSYSVSEDTSLQYRMVQAGSTGVTIARIRLEANTNEAIDVKQIAFQLSNTGSNSPADLVGEKASIWVGGAKIGTIQFGGASPDEAVSTLDGPIRAPKGESVLVTVKGDLSAHSSIEGTPGALLTIDYDGDTNGLSGNYGTGVSSGATISGTSSDTSTNGVRIFRTVPTVEDVTASDNLLAGADLYKIKITADSGRDVGIRSLAFDVSATGATVDDYQLYGPSGAVNATAVSASGGVVTIVFDNTHVDRLISAGTSKTYALRANTVTGLTSSATETLTIALRGDASYPGVTGLMGTVSEIEGLGATVKNFIWTPFSASIPEATSDINSNDDWTNGYGAPGFPGLGQNMPTRVFRD